MNTTDVQDRLVAATELNGALVEVQHPGAPWNNKIVIWMMVDDASAEAVVDDVREVASFAADDPDLSGEALTLVAVEGGPEDFPDRASLVVARTEVMGDVAATVGGIAADGLLELTADQVRALAEQ